jgi:hypothetical protein
VKLLEDDLDRAETQLEDASKRASEAERTAEELDR